jgi:hypothetical protein
VTWAEATHEGFRHNAESTRGPRLPKKTKRPRPDYAGRGRLATGTRAGGLAGASPRRSGGRPRRADHQSGRSETPPPPEGDLVAPVARAGPGPPPAIHVRAERSSCSCHCGPDRPRIGIAIPMNPNSRTGYSSRQCRYGAQLAAVHWRLSGSRGAELAAVIGMTSAASETGGASYRGFRRRLGRDVSRVETHSHASSGLACPPPGGTRPTSHQSGPLLRVTCRGSVRLMPSWWAEPKDSQCHDAASRRGELVEEMLRGFARIVDASTEPWNRDGGFGFWRAGQVRPPSRSTNR